MKRVGNTLALAAAVAMAVAPNQSLAANNNATNAAANNLPGPPGPPTTLWNFLGIPQGMNKIRDGLTNRRGNFPGLERKPPLKALADPQNLLSNNPAIKKAAEIKAEEDLKPQKIKAIKYLATIGCGCYPGVKDALMAALDDCTEDVRLAAVEAIASAAGEHCKVCDRNCCCDQELSLKLADIAYEMNDKCCFKEPSEAVREAAKEALRACCPGTGPPPVQQQEQRGGVETREPNGSAPEPREASPGPGNGANGGGAIQETRTMLPAGDAVASDASEQVEVFTVTFGNEQVARAERGAVQSLPVAQPRVQRSPTAPTAPQITRTDRNNASSLAAPSEPSAAPVGPSSRRRAAQRGVGDEVAAPVPAAPVSFATEASVSSEPAAGEPSAKSARNDSLPESAPAAVERVMAPSDVRGTVAHVNNDSGTVEIKFPGGAALPAGTRLVVMHQYLMKKANLGYLEVVAAGQSMVTARPVGELSLSKISRGDTISVGTIRPNADRTNIAANSKTSPAGKPATRSDKLTRKPAGTEKLAEAGVRGPGSKVGKADTGADLARKGNRPSRQTKTNEVATKSPSAGSATEIAQRTEPKAPARLRDPIQIAARLLAPTAAQPRPKASKAVDSPRRTSRAADSSDTTTLPEITLSVPAETDSAQISDRRMITRTAAAEPARAEPVRKLSLKQPRSIAGD